MFSALLRGFRLSYEVFGFPMGFSVFLWGFRLSYGHAGPRLSMGTQGGWSYGLLKLCQCVPTDRGPLFATTPDFGAPRSTTDTISRGVSTQDGTSEDLFTQNQCESPGCPEKPGPPFWHAELA